MVETSRRDQPAVKNNRGLVQIDESECKGCGLCIEACPPKVICMREQLNHYGYRTAVYSGTGCTGCGICFVACPEPGAITVFRAMAIKSAQSTAIAASGAQACASN